MQKINKTFSAKLLSGHLAPQSVLASGVIPFQRQGFAFAFTELHESLVS